MDSLSWLADRHEAARVLWDCMEPTEDREIFTIPEHDAWEFAEAYEHGDGGAPLQIPCCGGRLAEEVQNLWESIV